MNENLPLYDVPKYNGTVRRHISGPASGSQCAQARSAGFAQPAGANGWLSEMAEIASYESEEQNLMAQTREQEYVLNLARLQFYKKYFGRVLVALIVALVVIGVLIAAFVVVKNQKVEREYFAVDGQGRLTKIISLGQPFVSDSRLLTWAQQCVTDANTYDFVNFQKQFQQNSQCFTKDGWDQFMTAVERAGSLETVKTQRLVAQGIAAGASVVLRKGLRRGVYTWEIEQPVTVTYQGGQAGRTSITQKILVTLTISRVPTYESEEGKIMSRRANAFVLLIATGLAPLCEAADAGSTAQPPAQSAQGGQIPPPGTPIPNLPKLPGVNSAAFKQVSEDATPLSPDQIKTLRKLVDDAERAASAPPRFIPKPVSSSVTVSLMPGETPPVARLFSNYVSNILFVDQVGNPLIVTDVDSGGASAFTVTLAQGAKQGSNVIKLSPKSTYAMGNISVSLEGVASPVSLTLVSGQREVDYRVDVRVRGVGASARSSGFPLPAAANPAMQGMLEGVAPDGSRSLMTSNPEVQAWEFRNRFYVRTGYTLLSPAYMGMQRSADGTSVYEIPPTPVLIALVGGSTVQINLSGY
ncbi:hypothetical protein DFQ28_003496 [Apophysomyces sp. BC1034]|nr:hypothetical protein DFQ28_003496 [Apophysomyces sp. BC1034]